MADKDPTITKMVIFLQTFWKNLLLFFKILFECIVNFCELVIKVFITAVILILVLYISAVLFGYVAPPDFMNIPSFNVIVI